MKTRKEMIDLLVENDLFDWNDNESRNQFIETVYRTGFVGYETMSDEQLLNEFLDREFEDK